MARIVESFKGTHQEFLAVQLANLLKQIIELPNVKIFKFMTEKEKSTHVLKDGGRSFSAHGMYQLHFSLRMVSEFFC